MAVSNGSRAAPSSLPPILEPYSIDSFSYEQVQASPNKLTILNSITKFVEETETKLRENNLEGLTAEIYIQLGHWNLHLREFQKTISAYNKYSLISGTRPNDTKILYGLGVANLNLNKLDQAKLQFNRILELDEQFPRKHMIFYALGKILKLQRNFDQSIEFFCQILCFPELRERGLFHLAHLYILKGSYQEAVHILRGLLTSNLTYDTHLASGLMLQWLQLHYFASVPDSKIITPINSLINQPGFMNYLFGRVFAQLGDTVKAFNSYKKAFESKSCSPLIWCSIGILYHQQQQALDALQAYICSLQLDPGCTPSWINLAILYEACGQNIDALLCYRNTIKYFNETPSLLNTWTPNALQNKIQFLESLAGGNESSHLALTTMSKNLPTLKLAWSLPVPIEHIHKVRSNSEAPLLSPEQLSFSTPLPPLPPLDPNNTPTASEPLSTNNTHTPPLPPSQI